MRIIIYWPIVNPERNANKCQSHQYLRKKISLIIAGTCMITTQRITPIQYTRREPGGHASVRIGFTGLVIWTLVDGGDANILLNILGTIKHKRPNGYGAFVFIVSQPYFVSLCGVRPLQSLQNLAISRRALIVFLFFLEW